MRMFQAQVTACAEAWNGEQAASGEPEAWLWGEADGSLERVPTRLPSFLSTGGPSWPSILRNHIQQTYPTSATSAMAARTIIIDHGSGFLKSGLAGWNEPQLIFPSIVNYIPCRENPGPSYARRRVSLGIDMCRPDTFSYPVQRGRVLNWEGVEHLWSFVLEKHRQEHDDSPVMVTESPLKEPGDRQKTLEVWSSGGCPHQGARNSLALWVQT